MAQKSYFYKWKNKINFLSCLKTYSFHEIYTGIFYLVPGGDLSPLPAHQGIWDHWLFPESVPEGGDSEEYTCAKADLYWPADQVQGIYHHWELQQPVILGVKCSKEGAIAMYGAIIPAKVAIISVQQDSGGTRLASPALTLAR